jgi:nickel-dependent lactate racemase
MEYHLAYGKSGLKIEIDDDLDVTLVEPINLPGLPDPVEAITQSLRAPIGSPPLQDLVSSGDRIGIVVNDLTRPTPTPMILDALREALSAIPDEDIQLFIATGTHRANTRDELESMLGSRWLDRFTIHQNDALDESSHLKVGRTRAGGPVLFHHELMACDLRIATGFIEPHIFAGFSGGGKAFLPGMAGLDTILANHSSANIDNPNSTWGVIDGNPIQAEIREGAAFCQPSFLVNVTLNQERKISNVFAGELLSAHQAGCDFVQQNSMVSVEQAFNIVITTNAGYPLDLNVYQSVKGMSAAAQITRPGGAIIIAAECWDGIPEHGEYARLMQIADTPAGILEAVRAPGFICQDSWQAQIQALIAAEKDIYLYSHLLPEEQARQVKLNPSPSIEDTVEALLGRFGRSARICVMPEGPLTIPYIQS